MWCFCSVFFVCVCVGFVLLRLHVRPSIANRIFYITDSAASVRVCIIPQSLADGNCAWCGTHEKSPQKITDHHFAISWDDNFHA